MALCLVYRWIQVACFITCIASFRLKKKSASRENLSAWWSDCCDKLTHIKSGAQGAVYGCACKEGKGQVVIKEETVTAPSTGAAKWLSIALGTYNRSSENKMHQINGQMSLSDNSSYIVGVPAQSLVGNTHTILMERLYDDLESLREPLKTLDDTVRMQVIAAVFVSLMRGVHHMHARGFVHEDIKPGNLMLGGGIDVATEPLKCQVKITDFGTTYSSEMPEVNKHFGDPRYLAPELMIGMAKRIAGPYDWNPVPSDDMYAVGVTLLQLWLQGQPQARIPSSLHEIQDKELWWIGPKPAFLAASGEKAEKTGKPTWEGVLAASAQHWVTKDLFQYAFPDEQGYLPEPLYRFLFESDVQDWEADQKLLNQAYLYGNDPDVQENVGKQRAIRGLLLPRGSRLDSKDALDLAEDLYRSVAGGKKAPDFADIFSSADPACLECMKKALVSTSA